MITPKKFVELGGTITHVWTKYGNTYKAEYFNEKEFRSYVGNAEDPQTAVDYALFHRMRHKASVERTGRKLVDNFSE